MEQDVMRIDNTSYCENCRYCTLDESNKAKIMVTCDFDGKTRIYGQYVDCDRKEEAECSEEE